MDEQVGRINNLVKELGVENDTMIWFCSDNGPEGSCCSGRNHGSTGGLRGYKRSLFNGGVGVPALLKWPKYTKSGQTFEMPCSTLDYFPTIMNELGYKMPDNRPIDGISLIPMLKGEMQQRPIPIPYRFLAEKTKMFGSPTLAMIDNQFKYLTNLSDNGDEDMCFDLLNDPYETTNIIKDKVPFAKEMRDRLSEFIVSCKKSHRGGDYKDSYSPVNDFQELTGTWR